MCALASAPKHSGGWSGSTVSGVSTPIRRRVSCRPAMSTTTVSPSTTSTTVAAPGSAGSAAGSGAARDEQAGQEQDSAHGAPPSVRCSAGGSGSHSRHMAVGIRQPVPPTGSDALEEGAGAEAAAAAHGDQGGARVGALQLVHGLGDAGWRRCRRGGGRGRWPRRWGSPCPCRRSSSFCPGQHHRGEGLVDLDQVDVVHRHRVALEQVVGGVDGAGEHEDRVDCRPGRCRPRGPRG